MAKTRRFIFGGKELALRLDAQAIVQIENTLNKGMFELFFDDGKPRFPKLSDLLIFMQSANKNHGLKQKDMLDLYGKYMQAGKGYMDLYEVAMEVLEDSGFFGKEDAESKTNSDSSEDNVLMAKLEE